MRGAAQGPERTSRECWVNAWICISVYKQKTDSPVRERERERAREVHTLLRLLQLVNRSERTNPELRAYVPCADVCAVSGERAESPAALRLVYMHLKN